MDLIKLTLLGRTGNPRSFRALRKQEADTKHRLGLRQPNHPTRHDSRIISLP